MVKRILITLLFFPGAIAQAAHDPTCANQIALGAPYKFSQGFSLWKKGGGRSVAMSADGSHLAFLTSQGGGGRPIPVFESSGYRKFRKCFSFQGGYSTLAFNRDGSRLIAGSVSSGDYTVFDTETGDPLPKLHAPEALSFPGGTQSLAMSGDGSMAAAGVDHTVLLYQLNSPPSVEVLDPLTKAGRARAITFSVDGNYLAAGFDVGGHTEKYSGFVVVWKRVAGGWKIVLRHQPDLELLEFRYGLEGVPGVYDLAFRNEQSPKLMVYLSNWDEGAGSIYELDVNSGTYSRFHTSYDIGVGRGRPLLLPGHQFFGWMTYSGFFQIPFTVGRLNLYEFE